MHELQKQVQEFCDQHGLKSPAINRYADLVSELGEVGKELNKMSDYGRKPETPREEVHEEMGDVLFVLLALANDLDVDLESELKKVLKKMERRLKKGSAGSEND